MRSLPSRTRRLRRRVRRRIRDYRAIPHPRTRRTAYAVGILAGLAVVWILVTGFLARQQLERLQVRVQAVKALVTQGRLDEARSVAAQLPDIAAQAHRLTTGPAWWAASLVPYAGDPVDVVRATTTAADAIGSDALPQLVGLAADLDPQHLRSSGDTVRLAPLEQASVPLAHIAKELEAVRARVDALPTSTWLHYVDDGRQTFATDLGAVTDYVGSAARASAVLPTMLGADGTKRYFVGLQNESEMRGTGGLPGSFAILTATNGTLHFTHFGSDQELLPAKTKQLIDTGLDFGTDYNRLYGASGPTSLYLNSNISPNFPYAARIWAAMWEKVSGQHVDGAVAVDPQVLANFLAVTGPVSTPDGTGVAANDVVSLTEEREYVLFPNFDQRKAFLTNVLRATSTQILSEKSPPLGLLRAMSTSSLEHRVLAWSSDPRVEAAIAATNYAGVIPDQAQQPFVGLVLNNAAAGKLDYYLSRSLNYDRVTCGATASTTVTITLHNGAPAGGLPGYVAGRGDEPPLSAKPGDNRTLLDYFATAGAQLTSVTIDNKQATSAVLQERGHPVYRIDLELPRAETRVVVLHLSEPAGSGPVHVWHQPGVRPLTLDGTSEACS